MNIFKGLLLGLLAHFQICSALTPTPTQIEEFSKSQKDFSLNLYSALEKEQNLVFSPYSIFSCLSMIYVGAREETASEIKKTLSLESSQEKTASLSFTFNRMIAPKTGGDSHYQLNIANGLWVNKDSFVLSDYRHILQDDFEAQVDELDFSRSDEAIQVINEWTSNTTEGKIPHLLEPGDVNKLTRLVLTNALYFKGNWSFPFDVKMTKEANFHVSPKTDVIVPMMEQTSTFLYLEHDLFQMVALPFEGTNLKNDGLGCLILLPKEGISFSALEECLSSSALSSWITGLSHAYMKLQIPRFELKRRLNLNETLKKMGMKIAFTDRANFSGIDGMRDLFVHKVVHETYFALNESGVTAAAATAGSIGLTSFPEEKPIAFIANHPFLFFVVDMNNGVPLFMGKLAQPK